MVEYETKREWCPLPQPRKHWEVFNYFTDDKPQTTTLPSKNIEF